MSGKLGKRMSGKYPITRKTCPVCEELSDELGTPIVEKKFSSRGLKPRDSPVHNWYTYVHSYSPKFVEYEIEKKGISSDEKVLDPFVVKWRDFDDELMIQDGFESLEKANEESFIPRYGKDGEIVPEMEFVVLRWKKPRR